MDRSRGPRVGREMRAFTWAAVALIAGCGAAQAVSHATDPDVRALEWLVGCWREQGIDTYLDIEWHAEPGGLRGDVHALDVGAWRTTLAIERRDGDVVLVEAAPTRFFGHEVSIDSPSARLLATSATAAAFEGIALSLTADGERLVVDLAGDPHVLPRCPADGRLRRTH